MTPTEQFIDTLAKLKTGEVGLLRTHAGQGIDESVEAFDLFAGLWWPLRRKNERAPRRGVAWLIAKLYASRPISHASDQTLARQLGLCQPRDEQKKQSFRQRFDGMLMLPLGMIEPALRWALSQIASGSGYLDWVRLTDDLSMWERESTRLKWAEQFLETNEGGKSC